MNTNIKIWKTITIGGKPKLKGINISSYAQDMLDKTTFQRKKAAIHLVRLKVSEILPGYPTAKQIYEKIKEMGLELCPPEVGPFLRDDYREQAMHEWLYIGMKQITARDGLPRVFSLERGEDGLWLLGNWTDPGYEWSPGHEFVFRLRKLKNLGTSHPRNMDTLELRISELEKRMDKLKEI